MTARKEERHIVEMSKIEKLIGELESFASQRIFRTGHNHTVYFNNSDHEVPFEVSIKSRRYDSVPFTGNLDPEDVWIFEIKRDILNGNLRLREKQRKNIALKGILEELSRTYEIGKIPISSALRPFVSDSYRRRHYIVRGEEDFRITIDDGLFYHFFEEGFEGKAIGEEDYARIEIKMPSHKIESIEAQRINGILTGLGAIPAISKKDMAYNLLSEYLRNKSRRSVPESDTEIEAKLLLDREHQYVFHQIKNDFRNRHIAGFVVSKEFPYTLEGGKLHQYIFSPQKGSLRISMKGKSKKAVSKENSEIVGDSFGLGCIIKRRETKAPLPDSILSLPSETIYRKRKYFIVENEATGNSYCILIDRGTYGGNELYQMEIEGLLLSPSRDKEEEIIGEIAYLVKQLVQKYPMLEPMPLTKLEWLRKCILNG